MAETMVVSLGGNAFAAAGQAMSMAGQFAFAEQSLEPLGHLLATDSRILITHGNGPQVGYILTRVEAALGKAYSLPLEVCVAESEGEIGYVLQQTIYNLTSGRRPVATLLTQVVVDADDPAFASPDKPVGPWFSAEQAAQLAAAGMPLVYDEKGRGRRVVASPAPLEIVEIEVVRQMLSLGITVIAAGGGGIPVAEKAGRLEGVEAVVDKDLATAMLAIELDAEQMVLVTGVPGVYRDFAGPGETLLRHTSPEELEVLAEEGHFPAGSMGPKVASVIQFVRATGRRAVVCQPADLASAMLAEAGTVIEPLS